MNNQEYVLKLQEFCDRLKKEQKEGLEARGRMDDTKNLNVFYETGRKYDKIWINNQVRYFVNRETGAIYGAKSPSAPNTKWYFGTLETAPLWNWSDLHGIPVNDDSVRAVKSYGPYVIYIPI